MADFRDVARELAPRGGWLRDPASQAWLGAMGGAVSASQALWRETVKARFASTAPEDALVLIGDTRQIERAPRETAAAYRLRLARCFEIHTERTTPDAYRNALEPLGVAEADVFVYSHFEVAIGLHWSTVWIVVDSTAGPWTEALWDDGGSWDDGGVWDLDGLQDIEVHWLRRTIRKWKWAGAYPVAIWVWTSGDVWDDGGLWDDGGVWTDDAGITTPILLGHLWDEQETLYGGEPDKWDDGGVWDDFEE